MSKEISIDHESGQRFLQHSGTVAAVKTFNVPATKMVDTTTGELVTRESERRFQLVVKTDDGLIATLDSINLEQLQIVTGKELASSHTRLLRNAYVTWYVSNRTEAAKYYFRPDATTARISPRTGKFTSLALVEPVDTVWDKWDAIPDRDTTIVVDEVDDKSFAAFQKVVKEQLAADKK